MLRPPLRLPTIHLAVLAICAWPGCTGPGAAPADALLAALPPADRSLLQPRSCCYGVYVDGHKVGFAGHDTELQVDAAGEAVLHRGSRLSMWMLEGDRRVAIATAGDEDYEAAPPFGLRRMRLTRQQGDEVTTTMVERDGGEFAIVQEGAGAPQRRRMPALGFGLRDTLAEAQWLLGDPEPGARLHVRTLDTDQLAVLVTTTTLLAKGTTAGGERWFDVERTGASDGSVERDRLAADGSSLLWQLGSLQLRRESCDTAASGVAAVDFGQLGSVPVATPLGDPRRIAGLELLLQGPAAAAFADAPGQRAEAADGGEGGVRLRTEAGLAVTADADEQARCRRATLRLPADDPQLRALADKAIAGAADDGERVRRLCAFVASFVADDAVVCDHATVARVVQSRRGDCSDHALLLATLLRAAGLPARTVAGLVYAGDAAAAFTPHEWCEVVVDGSWLAVDPMWNEVPADATHLRLSASAAASPPQGGLQITVLGRR